MVSSFENRLSSAASDPLLCNVDQTFASAGSPRGPAAVPTIFADASRTVTPVIVPLVGVVPEYPKPVPSKRNTNPFQTPPVALVNSNIVDVEVVIVPFPSSTSSKPGLLARLLLKPIVA